MADSELDRLKARRVTALYRLDLIARGAQLTYEDGTLIDMASERDRLDTVVADLDRRIESLERTLN
ncbi:hypothetical protein [Brevundimonas sp. TWP2-3-4b2]|uniref:hypothetical protein n=1 Tax=Brevundimonas sp. TWP2-3-4b2 TaxID=2804595 RepID=UPI003CF66F65